MAELSASTSLLGHPPPYTGAFVKNFSNKRRSSDNCRFPAAQIHGRRMVMAPPLPRLRVNHSKNSSINSLAMDLAKDAYSFMEDDYFRKRKQTGPTIPPQWDYPTDTGIDRKPGFWPADNPSLQMNPLLRKDQMGGGSLAAMFEWEGVLVEDNTDLERQAWQLLSQEEGKSPPPDFSLRRIHGMKNEQAISDALCWSRDPAQTRRMGARKEGIFQALQGGKYRLRDGSREFLNVLMHYKIPMALVSTRPRKYVEAAIGVIGVEGFFDVMVAGEDIRSGKPDPEIFEYAARLLRFMPERCIVFGNSNQSVEAAHDGRMKCVAVASKHPVYELAAADLVVRRLDELSVVDLKNLADVESTEFGLEMEEEVEERRQPG